MKQGYRVVNPIKEVHPKENATWHYYMKEDIKLLMDCDSIYMLCNYKESQGAKLELQIAVGLAYDIMFQE